MNAEKRDPDGWDTAIHAGGADECARRLSCLLDGELDEPSCQQVFDELRRNEDACRQWSMLNCVGDSLRSAEVAACHSEGFVARVAAALEKEPTVLAPAAGRQPIDLRRWLLPGAGAATAAAVLLVVGLPSRQLDEAKAVAQAGKAVPVASVAVVPGPVQVDRSPLLERYLMAHRELAEPTLMPYSTPYVRTSGAVYPQETR